MTTGLRKALVRAGHDVRDYRLDNRLELAGRAIPKELHTVDGLSKIATESVLVEATYHKADFVLIVCGLYFHEVGLWLLDHYDIPTAVVMTESPYQDEAQANWVAKYPSVVVFTQERTSAVERGWHYLGAAYDADVHHPVDPDPTEACDVLFIGTGFPERQKLFEGVDWSGVDLKLRGLFPEMTEASPLARSYVHGCVDNHQVPKLYASCKVALNPYRESDHAESLNPRALELAACGVFQLADRRLEGVELFGDSVPTYSGSVELEQLVRYYLKHPDERRAKARESCRRVKGQTFDARVDKMMSVLEPRQVAAV